MAALESIFDQPAEPRYAWVRDLLVDHRDGASTARFLDRLASVTGVAR
jgi:hypothetical protein